jgi:WD40 repeat protein
VVAVGFSTDGKLVASADQQGLVKLWDVAVRGEGDTLGPSPGNGRFYCFSPASGWLAEDHGGGTIGLWNAFARIQRIIQTGYPGGAAGVAFSSDGRLLATVGSSGNRVKLWDVITTAQLGSFEDTQGEGRFSFLGSRGLGFSPDGRFLVMAKGGLALWDVRTFAALPGVELDKSRSPYVVVGFSPNGRVLAASTFFRTALWDLGGGQPGHAVSAEGSLVALSPDGTTFATATVAAGNEASLHFWDMATKAERATLTAFTHPFTFLAFSPDGRTLAARTRDGVVRLFQTATGQELFNLAGSKDQWDVLAFSADGKTLLTAGAGQVTVWSAASRPAERSGQAEGEKEAVLVSRAESLARRGQWNAAAAEFSTLVQLRPENHAFYHSLAPLLVQSGQRERYRSHCEQVLVRFGATSDPFIAERMAKDCLIAADPGVNLQAVDALAGLAVTLGRTNGYLPYFQLAKGLAEYRQGRFAEAADYMEQVLPKSKNIIFLQAQASLVNAMALHRLGRAEPARLALAAGVELIESKLPKINSGDLGVSWTDWIICHQLTAEAKALVEGGANGDGTVRANQP